jgi:hypothetical protein
LGLIGRWSESFRAEHGDDEVDEERERDERDDDGFHGGMVKRVGREVQRTFSQK